MVPFWTTIDEYFDDNDELIETTYWSGTTFVHSKHIIAGDEYAVVGSANMNDRSMEAGGDLEAGTL